MYARLCIAAAPQHHSQEARPHYVAVIFGSRVKLGAIAEGMAILYIYVHIWKANTISTLIRMARQKWNNLTCLYCDWCWKVPPARGDPCPVNKAKLLFKSFTASGVSLEILISELFTDEKYTVYWLFKRPHCPKLILGRLLDRFVTWEKPNGSDLKKSRRVLGRKRGCRSGNSGLK